MGKVILCAGREAKKAYHIRAVDVEITSIEELCYVLYHNAFVMQEELFSEELIQYIGEELGMSERAAYLRRLWESHAGTKDIAVAIFCSTDYYNEKEIKDFLASYDAFYAMTKAERSQWTADRMLSEKKYREAAEKYLEILHSEDMAALSEKEQGNIYHNLAVTENMVGNLWRAADYFQAAYQKNQSEASLRQYLTTLKLSGQEERLKKELQRLTPRREVIDRMNQEMYMARMAAEQIPDYQNYERVREAHESGHVQEYYQKAEQLLRKIKSDYRRRQ